MGRLPILAGLVWSAVLATAALFTYFWLAGHYRPGAVWGAITVAAMLTPLLALLAGGGVQLFRGPRRAQALGWMLVGTTPFVWLTGHFTQLATKARTREPVSVGLATRVSVLWASPLFEIEARRRYPRWTHGKHVVLIDEGELSTVDRLVAAMDEHLMAMAKLLGRPMPTTEMAWVRGPMFGQDGRAALMWALCGYGRADDPELNYVDRHEAAHVLITALCGPHQYPPCLLAEGWAESQGNDRDQQIVYLAERHSQGTVCSLQELVGPEWYTRDDGAVYWVGGPLVTYLIERYGGPKFLELYDGVRPATFLADCQTILGDSWGKVEEDFWSWLAARSETVLTEHERSRATWNELDEGVDPRDWKAFLARYHAAHLRNFSLPEHAAFEYTTESVADATDTQPEQRSTAVINVVRRGEEFWMLSASTDEGACVFMAAGQKSACIRHDSNSELENWARGWASRWEAYVQGVQLLDDYWHPADLGGYVPWWPGGYASRFRVRSIDRPAEEDEPWRVVFAESGNDGTPPLCHHVTFDPQHHWQITSVQVTSDHITYEVEATYQSLGSIVAPRSYRSSSPGAPDEPARSSRYTLRELSPAEAKAMQQRVEAAADEAPRPYATLRRIMLGAVFVWPLAGVSLVFRSGRMRDDVSLGNVSSP